MVGLGSMGAMMTRLVLEKGMEIVAAFTRETHLGRDLGEAVGIDKKLGVLVSNRLHEIIRRGREQTAREEYHLGKLIFREIQPSDLVAKHRAVVGKRGGEVMPIDARSSEPL